MIPIHMGAPLPAVSSAALTQRDAEYWRATALAEAGERKRLATELAFARDLICELSQRQPLATEPPHRMIDSIERDLYAGRVQPADIERLAVAAHRAKADASLRRLLVG